MPVHPDIPNLFGLHQYDGCAHMRLPMHDIMAAGSHLPLPRACVACMPPVTWRISHLRSCGAHHVHASARRVTSFFNGSAPLSQASGYAIVVGFGARLLPLCTPCPHACITASARS